MTKTEERMPKSMQEARDYIRKHLAQQDYGTVKHVGTQVAGRWSMGAGTGTPYNVLTIQGKVMEIFDLHHAPWPALSGGRW